MSNNPLWFTIQAFTLNFILSCGPPPPRFPASEPPRFLVPLTRRHRHLASQPPSFPASQLFSNHSYSAIYLDIYLKKKLLEHLLKTKFLLCWCIRIKDILFFTIVVSGVTFYRDAGIPKTEAYSTAEDSAFWGSPVNNKLICSCFTSHNKSSGKSLQLDWRRLERPQGVGGE